LDVEISESVEMWKSPASGSKMIYGSTGWRTEGLGSAAPKPAPFAEKKNAKDAAPAESIRGATEVRCEAEG
jgi:hypothetical protein